MKMKTRLLAGVLLLMSGLALADQSAPRGPRGLDIDKLEILLDLDAYQKQEVEKVLIKQREAMRAKREQMRSSQGAEQTRPSREQMEQERQAARKATRDELAKVLSEQQLKKLDVLTEHPPMRGGKYRHGATAEEKTQTQPK
jgi:hypothetical protein